MNSEQVIVGVRQAIHPIFTKDAPQVYFQPGNGFHHVQRICILLCHGMNMRFDGKFFFMFLCELDQFSQRLTLSGMTRRGVASPELVTFILCGLFMGASSISQMPGLVSGMVTMVSTSCIYLWLKDPRFDARRLLRISFLNCQGINQKSMTEYEKAV